MADDDKEIFQAAWVEFVESVYKVLEQKRLQRNRAYVNEYYWQFFTGTNEVVKSNDFANNLSTIWYNYYKSDNTKNQTDNYKQNGAQLLLLELEQYPKLVNQIFEDKNKKPKIYNLKNALSIAKTIIDSIKAILALSEWGKLFLDLYSEAIDIFKG